MTAVLPLALDRRGRAPHEAVSRSQRLRSRLARPPSSPSGNASAPCRRLPDRHQGRPCERGRSARGRNAGGLPLVIQPLQPVPEDAVATKSAFIVPQDATRLNQGHCGSPEDNPVFILPASDPASPSPEGSASRGNPSRAPWMYHDGATAGLVSRGATWVRIQSTFKVRGCS